MARVLVLNGLSSVGKTTLAKAIQNASSNDFLHLSMDAFIAMTPDGREADPCWFPVHRRKAGGQAVVSITIGPRGKELLAAMRRTVSHLADSGFDIVVDEVCRAPEIADYRNRLSAHRVHFVKVEADLALIERRERERGDRLIGLAREQATHLHDGITYDQTVDTGCCSPDECARSILDRFS